MNQFIKNQQPTCKQHICLLQPSLEPKTAMKDIDVEDVHTLR